MVIETTEQEAPPKLEDILSEEAVEVSEDVTEDVTEEPVEEVEEKDEDPLSPENFENRVRSEADKRIQHLAEVRISDAALIRRYKEDIAELRKQNSESINGKRLNRLLEGYDEEGLPEEKKATFETDLKAINKEIAEYNDKSAKVEEAAKFISDMAEFLPSKIVSGFSLDDVNPSIRVKNYSEFINETVSVYNHNQNFLMAVEEFLPKGDEVRKQLEELVEGMADYEGNDKAKKLYLADKRQGLKLTPRRAPRSPSDGSGGEDLSRLSMAEKIGRHIEKADKKINK